MSDSEDEDGESKLYLNISAKELRVSKLKPESDGSSGDTPGTIVLSDNLEVGGDGLILHDLEEFVSDDDEETITYADNSIATASAQRVEQHRHCALHRLAKRSGRPINGQEWHQTSNSRKHGWEEKQEDDCRP